jgi:hypothetical protein
LKTAMLILSNIDLQKKFPKITSQHLPKMLTSQPAIPNGMVTIESWQQILPGFISTQFIHKSFSRTMSQKITLH